jgi:transposase
MRIETILNKCQKFKSFVYKNVSWGKCNGEDCIEAEIIPRKNSRAICSCCHRPASLYDKLKVRSFEFVPIWGYRVFFIYQMRRVDCKYCGVFVEELPWASGKYTLTKTYMKFLSDWARKLSWLETARSFKTSWRKVFDAVRFVVDFGLKNRDLSGIESIGVDEIAIQKGHKYLTVVYQIDKHCIRLLWVGKDRTVKTMLRFFRMFGKPRTKNLKHICSDMWKPYLKVIKKKAPQALHILDRFHIMANINKAIDKVRAEEHRKLEKDGYEPVLKKTRWCLLKRKENLTEKQAVKLSDLLAYNLKAVKSYLLKEELNLFWEYVSPHWAGKFLDTWCAKVMRSKIEPMKKMAKSLRKHKPLILNWFKAKKAYSSGIVEGLNNKAKLATKKAYGFKTFECAEIALYHQLGKLPEPLTTHRF